MYNVAQLGQVFTPPFIVSQMLQLRQNQGHILEPSAGDGSFFANIPNCVGIEIDPNHSKEGMLNIDFFDYPIAEKFDTIIGNPPYVRYQDIPASTKQKFKSVLFDERSNLYLFFIEKCIKHLQQNGELIFITPRDFLKATSSVKLNKFIYEQGTITDIIDLGDSKVFNGFSPNCIIWRFEKNNFTRKTNTYKQFVLCNGQLMFTDNNYPILFSDIFAVKVGAVSGCDEIFTNPTHGNEDFVCSATYKTGETKRMIFNVLHESLIPQKEKLISRGIRPFNEKNWWQWGRLHHQSKQARIYVNAKTRNNQPFFTHPCLNYDGAILGIFPHNTQANVKLLTEKLNRVNWLELGFVCDGRYMFSQRSLENTLLPDYFAEDVPKSLLQPMGYKS
jgi:adenine-specific DNA-methyltransferase